LLAVWKLTPARAATSLIETYFRRATDHRLERTFAHTVDRVYVTVKTSVVTV
jgi:hypothetical protein